MIYKTNDLKYVFRNFSILVLISLTVSCAKSQKETTETVIGDVELYLIDYYSTIGNTCQIDEKTIKIQEKPLINYSEFIYYDPELFEFKISDSAITKIKDLDYSVTGLPFVVVAKDSIVYSGYFIPLWSSTSCNWTIISPTILPDHPVLRVKLGYPGSTLGHEIPDRRNEQRLIDIFKRDNKLK